LAKCISGSRFAQYIVDQQPYFDALILRDTRPEDGWLGHMETGKWEDFTGVSHSYDRFRHVSPDVTKIWQDVPEGHCVGAPCDPPEYQIGWGWDRQEYSLERQSWVSPLLCFDQARRVTHAREHFAQIIEEILRPSTSRITSFYMRKRLADLAEVKWVASKDMKPFTYTWEVTGDREIYINTTADPTSKLTPQMLQRRVDRLRYNGYFGKQPFKDMPPSIELATDSDTLWELDKVTADTNINQLWRFNTWDAANRYYKYAFTGQIGDYVTRVDPFNLRFNKVGNGRYQIVLPYRNVNATSGIGSEYNQDFSNAQYGFSLIVHRRSVVFLTADARPINAAMPFATRNLAGQWQFVMDNLGADCNGRPIDNKRRNKGQFLMDLELAAKPQYTELSEVIFHKREPVCVVEYATCNTDPGYPVQYYDSDNEACDSNSATRSFEPMEDTDGNFVIDANTITCNGIEVSHGAINAPDVSNLVQQLNAEASVVGVWILDGAGIILTEAPCDDVVIPWVTT
jgi:hypothetical protein